MFESKSSVYLYLTTNRIYQINLNLYCIIFVFYLDFVSVNPKKFHSLLKKLIISYAVRFYILIKVTENSIMCLV